MQKKINELNVVARLSESVLGDGFLHYGFWQDGLPEKPSLCALGNAQTDFVDQLISVFPPETKKILDVGSGTGAIAKYLTQYGYELACVCPSETMNTLARQKLPSGYPVYTSKFEEFESTDIFDLCIFAESFHYIDLPTALEKSAKLAQYGVVIFDYFRRESKETSANMESTRGTHAEFLAEVARQNKLHVIRDDDMTQFIIPTFKLLDHLQTNHLAPLLADIRTQMKSKAPIRSWIAEKLIGRRLDRIAQPRDRASKFADTFEYRLIVLEKIRINT